MDSRQLILPWLGFPQVILLHFWDSGPFFKGWSWCSYDLETEFRESRGKFRHFLVSCCTKQNFLSNPSCLWLLPGHHHLLCFPGLHVLVIPLPITYDLGWLNTWGKELTMFIYQNSEPTLLNGLPTWILLSPNLESCKKYLRELLAKSAFKILDLIIKLALGLWRKSSWVG